MEGAGEGGWKVKNRIYIPTLKNLTKNHTSIFFDKVTN